MSQLKLNLGCGPSGIESWLNYDWGVLPLLSKFGKLRRLLVRLNVLPRQYNIDWPPVELVDIRRNFPLKPNTVNFIYCSHVLEHFERWEALKILKECHRVLQKNGVLRIVVPDTEKMFKIYHQAKNRSSKELCRLWWGFNKDEEPKNFIQKLSRKFIRDHQWNYDESELKTLLKEANFLVINLCDFRKGNIPDLKKLDLKAHKNHSLYVEAVKTV